MNPDIGYLRGSLFETGTLVVLAASERLESQDIDHTLVGWWKENKWILLSQEDLTIVSVCKGKGKYYDQTVFAGMYGEVLIGTPSGVRREQLGKGKSAPNRLRTIHEVRAIGEYFFAVGMRRQVFRKHMGATSWEKIDNGTFVPDDSKEIAGFISVDGYTENEVYAVGHRGEIWTFNGKIWHQIDSPTKEILHCVRCMSDGMVWVCGAAGVILRGRGDTWNELRQDITDETILSLAGLGGQVYFATEDGVILTVHRDQFREIEIEKNKDVTTGFLDSNGKSILSIGESDIYLYNAKKWHKLTDPEFGVQKR